MIRIAQAPLVLASGSAARREMLRNAGVEFTVMATDLDEAPIKARALKTNTDVRDLAVTLAEAKARAAAAEQPRAWVLGADQVLVCDGVLFDKARDIIEAKETLRSLSGRKHELYAAACIVRNGHVVWRNVSTAQM
jgi:septum formation protein